MATRAIEWLLLDGRRYRLEENGFSRFTVPLEMPQLKAKRLQSPFVDAELTSFAGGISNADLDDEGTVVRNALGLEPTGTDPASTKQWLRVGRALEDSLDEAGAGQIAPLLSWGGKLWAGELGGDSIYQFNGTTWSLGVDLGTKTGGIRMLAELLNRIYASNGEDGVVQSSSDGTTWSASFILGSGCTGVYVLVHVLSGATPYLYVLGEDISVSPGISRARLHRWDGANITAAPLVTLQESKCRAGCQLGGVLYFCGAETADQVRGAIYSYDGSIGRRLVAVDANFATTATAYNGRTWWGMARRGELWSFDGASGLTFVRSFATSKPLGGLWVFQGALWVSVYNDAAARMELWRYDGAGWSQPSYIAEANDQPGGLAAYADEIYVGGGNASGPRRRVYKISTGSRHTAAALELPDVVFGAPSLLKRWRRISVQHSALLSGQAVEVRYRLDDGAEVSVGANRDVGATETAFELPDGVRGLRLRPKLYITNGTSQDLTLFSASLRALPAPDAREVWEAELRLKPEGSWADGAPDTDDPLAQLARLDGLRRAASTFQAVAPLRDGNDRPALAMRAALDSQVPMKWRLQAIGEVRIALPLRLVQAAGPQNLLLNASFEQDALGAAPTGWSASGTGTSSLVSAAVPAIGGGYELAIVFNGSAASYGRQQTVSGLVPGRYYTVSAFLRRAGMAAGRAVVYVSEGGVFSTQGRISLPAATDAGFVRVSDTFLYPANGSGTVSVFVGGASTPAGTLYVDAVMLEEGAPASAFREQGSGG